VPFSPANAPIENPVTFPCVASAACRLGLIGFVSVVTDTSSLLLVADAREDCVTGEGLEVQAESATGSSTKVHRKEDEIFIKRMEETQRRDYHRMPGARAVSLLRSSCACAFAC
jgi:hypothetical protein